MKLGKLSEKITDLLGEMEGHDEFSGYIEEAIRDGAFDELSSHSEDLADFQKAMKRSSRYIEALIIAVDARLTRGGELLAKAKRLEQES